MEEKQTHGVLSEHKHLVWLWLKFNFSLSSTVMNSPVPNQRWSSHPCPPRHMTNVNLQSMLSLKWKPLNWSVIAETDMKTKTINTESKSTKIPGLLWKLKHIIPSNHMKTRDRQSSFTCLLYLLLVYLPALELKAVKGLKIPDITGLFLKCWDPDKLRDCLWTHQWKPN